MPQGKWTYGHEQVPGYDELLLVYRLSGTSWTITRIPKQKPEAAAKFNYEVRSNGVLVPPLHSSMQMAREFVHRRTGGR